MHRDQGCRGLTGGLLGEPGLSTPDTNTGAEVPSPPSLVCDLSHVAPAAVPSISSPRGGGACKGRAADFSLSPSSPPWWRQDRYSENSIKYLLVASAQADPGEPGPSQTCNWAGLKISPRCLPPATGPWPCPGCCGDCRK